MLIQQIICSIGRLNNSKPPEARDSERHPYLRVRFIPRTRIRSSWYMKGYIANRVSLIVVASVMRLYCTPGQSLNRYDTHAFFSSRWAYFVWCSRFVALATKFSPMWIAFVHHTNTITGASDMMAMVTALHIVCVESSFEGEFNGVGIFGTISFYLCVFFSWNKMCRPKVNFLCLCEFAQASPADNDLGWLENVYVGIGSVDGVCRCAGKIFE